MTHKIVTIDGPAGSGKTTVSRYLAGELGCIYVDTGALYRGIAYEIDRRKIDWKSDSALEAFLPLVRLDFKKENDDLVLTSSGEDISGKIRTQEISMLASAVSARPMVRQALLEIQRDIGRQQTAVFEGRDMGTVVFPDADYKFFLQADLKVRSLRRFNETLDKNIDLATIEQEMALRDHNDSTRDIAPLKPAPDAVLIDSSSLTTAQVAKLMLAEILKTAPRTTT